LVWEADISPSLPVILMDPDRMAQALGNLVSNAIKFTPSGGQISITANVATGQFIMQVADSGPGISPQEQEKIFQPFYRGSHGRRVIEGMGLGLSIARDIVVAHGGEIELESTPGDGSRFTVRMQVEVPHEA
jgi:signal transduction histidine kinase